MSDYPTTSFPLVIGEVVADTTTDVLSDLQAEYSGIKTINYLYGNFKEITQRMSEMQQNQNYADRQFPLICLIEDITIERGNGDGLFGTATGIDVIIANWTKSDFTSADREAENFAKVLRPIYKSFMKNLADMPEFMIYTHRDIRHNYIERKYWGMDDNSANALGYYIDAIHISNMQIPLQWSYCDYVINSNIS